MNEKCTHFSVQIYRMGSSITVLKCHEKYAPTVGFVNSMPYYPPYNLNDQTIMITQKGSKWSTVEASPSLGLSPTLLIVYFEVYVQFS